jgi:HlyD family secretion protein
MAPRDLQRWRRRLLQSVLPFALVVPIASCDGNGRELRLVGSVERTHLELVASDSEVIVELPVERGERVSKGQLLVQLDPTLAEAEIASAEAVLAGARTGSRVSERELARLVELRRQGVASQQDLENAELRKAEAEARLREARARLAVARKRTADLTLHAPLEGVVDQLPFELGERVPAGAVLVVLQSQAPAWVRIWVPEHEVPLVHPGTRAEIRIDGLGERVLHGHVLDVAREPAFTPHYALTERDREYLVYEARVEIEDAPEVLRPGVPADVTLRVEPMFVASEPMPADG